jgi:hypothetical protein
MTADTLPHAPKPWRIDIHLPALRELFNALDPSPLVGRDVDDRVEEFIVGTAGDAPSHAPLELVVSTPPAPNSPKHEDVGDAVRAYFAYLRDAQRLKVRRLMREGRAAAVLGLAFLAVCMTIGQGTRMALDEPVSEFLREGLLIIGWVALWKPVEIFLYDWRPMRARARLYDRLSRMQVTVRES